MKTFKQFILEDIDSTTHDHIKREFGVTSDPSEAGYILHDGTMLDFSGRHKNKKYQLNNSGKNVLKNPDDKDHLNGQRNIDHREIADGLPEKMDGHEAMVHMMNKQNAIRYHPKVGFEISRRPTDAALNKAVVGHRKIESNHPLQVDISHPETNEILHTQTFHKPTIGNVKEWIYSKFKKVNDENF